MARIGYCKLERRSSWSAQRYLRWMLGCVLASSFPAFSCSSTSRYHNDDATSTSPTDSGGSNGQGGSATGSTGATDGSGTTGGSAGAGGEGGEACEPRSRSCNGLTPLTCSDDGVWLAASAECATACLAGECVECAEEETQCNDGAVHVCQQGTWETARVCDVTCETGACVTACTMDRLQCDGRFQLQRCNGTAYVDEQECDFVCVDGACTGECVPDEHRCNPGASNESQTCNALGVWDDTLPCETGSFCVQGLCKPCEPESKRCTETGPQSCSPDGEWVPLGACGADLPACHLGDCLLCQPGDKRCTNSDLEVCSQDGSGWTVLETCTGATPACIESTKSCGKCEEEQQQCNQDEVQVCNDTGAWEDLTDCSDDTPECLAGSCVECDPTTNQRQCVDSETAQSCASDGTWGTETNCTGDTPICREDLNFSCGCEEDARRCVGNQPQVCTGGAWVSQASCSGGTPHCLIDTGRCVACEPETEECRSGVAHTCSNDGSWTSLQACSGTNINCGGCDLGEHCEAPTDCSSGFCVSESCAECSPGTDGCSGTTPRTCTSQGSWDPQDPCPAPSNGNATCSGGDCGFTCVSGYDECDDRCIPNGACCSDSDCPSSASCKSDACVCDPGFTGPDCVAIFEPIARVSGQDGACEARGISGDGSLVVGFCQDSSYTSVAFSWTNGVMSPLEDGGGGGEAYGVSTNGSIVVGKAGGYPAKWVNGTRQMHLTLAGTDDDDASGYIMDVSADGNRLAGYSTDPYHIYYWVYWGSAANALPTQFWHWAALQTFQSMADDGDLLVGSTYENGLYRAAYFKISVGFTLWFQDVGSDRDHYAYAVSSNGSTVVGESHLMGDPTQEREAVVWRNFMSPDLLGVSGRADVVNANGTVIAGIGEFSGNSNAPYLWRDGDVVALQSALTSVDADISGWTLTAIKGMSSDGSVLVGYGINPSGVVQAWRVVLTGTDILDF